MFLLAVKKSHLSERVIGAFGPIKLSYKGLYQADDSQSDLRILL